MIWAIIYIVGLVVTTVVLTAIYGYFEGSSKERTDSDGEAAAVKVIAFIGFFWPLALVVLPIVGVIIGLSHFYNAIFNRAFKSGEEAKAKKGAKG